MDRKWSFLLNKCQRKKKLQHHFFWLLCLWFHLQIVYGLTNAIWILFIERDLYLYYHCQCSAIFVWAILWYQWPLEAQQAWLDSVWNYFGFLIKMSYWKNPHMYVYTIIALSECHQMVCPMAQTVCLGYINLWQKPGLDIQLMRHLCFFHSRLYLQKPINGQKY